MKVRINTKDLLEVVKVFRKGDFRNEPSGGRALVTLEAEGERLSVLSADVGGDLDLAVWIPAGVAGPGRITVDLRSLEDSLKRIASKEIELRVKKSDSDLPDRLNLVADDLISSMSVESDLSLMAEFRTPEAREALAEIPAGDLERALDLSLPSMSRDGARYALAGIYFDMEEDRLRLVATDGHRLSLTGIPVSAPVEPVIVPGRACVLLREILKRFPGGKVGIVSGEKEIVFLGEDWILRTVPIDGVYPDYRAVIPKEGLRMIVRAEEFEEVMKRFSKIKDTVVEIRPGDAGRLRIELGNEETSFGTEISAEFEADEVPEFVLAFNPPYLARVVKGRSGKLIIHATKYVVAFQFGNYPGDLELVAPMRLNDEHDFPETGPFSPLPSIEELSRWRVEIPEGSGRRTSGRTSGGIFSALKKRISELERENEVLRAEIERLEKLLRKESEACEFLNRQIKELRIENEYLRRGEIPLEPLPEGGVRAVFGGKVLVLRNGVILESSGNGGRPVGRYDRKTGFGLIEDRPIRLRRNGHGWVMVI